SEVASVLAGDPANRLGRLLPIVVREKHLEREERLNIPPLLRALNRLDFRDPSRRNKEIARLVALLRGEPLPRGRRRRTTRTHASILAPSLPASPEDPDHVQENLISNLLLVSG